MPEHISTACLRSSSRASLAGGYGESVLGFVPQPNLRIDLNRCIWNFENKNEIMECNQNCLRAIPQ